MVIAFVAGVASVHARCVYCTVCSATVYLFSASRERGCGVIEIFMWLARRGVTYNLLLNGVEQQCHFQALCLRRQ